MNIWSEKSLVITFSPASRCYRYSTSPCRLLKAALTVIAMTATHNTSKEKKSRQLEANCFPWKSSENRRKIENFLSKGTTRESSRYKVQNLMEYDVVFGVKRRFSNTLNWKKNFALSPSLGRGWRKLQWVGGSWSLGVEKREEEERTARWTLAEIDNVCVVFVCRAVRRARLLPLSCC